MSWKVRSSEVFLVRFGENRGQFRSPFLGQSQGHHRIGQSCVLGRMLIESSCLMEQRRATSIDTTENRAAEHDMSLGTR